MPQKDNFSVDCFDKDLLLTTISAKNPELKEKLQKEKKRLTLSTLNGVNRFGDVYLIWIMMWCITFKYVTGFERMFRVEQMIAVLL